MKFNPRKPEFIRFGGLSPVKQRGYTTKDEDRGYHTPPARKGIYAFPRGYIELFLLGGDSFINPKAKHTTNRVMYVRDNEGNVVTRDHPEYDKYSKNNNYWDIKIKLKEGATPDEDGEYWWDDYHCALVKRVHPKKFVYRGDIWHHLSEECKTIKKSVGSWILTDMHTYSECFLRLAKKYAKEAGQMQVEWGGDIRNRIQRNPFDWFSKDHLEVFIERIK